MSDEPAPEQTLAAKLDRLFRAVRPAGREAYSYGEVEAATRAAGGPTISAVYVWQLRKGKRTNPTMRHLEALATFFGVPPAYFFDDDLGERLSRELELIAALRDDELRALALESAGLSSASLAALRGMAAQARRLEGLPGPSAPTA